MVTSAGFLGLILGGIFGVVDTALTLVYIGVFLPIRFLLAGVFGI